ncbi:MAG: hypothetical protein KF748_08035 [Xanthobacteraceae bacterium]|nr:hypothetical protein [Xanthobacteraceae bacterium]MCW5676619.1 hypothetical protein [Xanthobacteraceae bacterium]
MKADNEWMFLLRVVPPKDWWPPQGSKPVSEALKTGQLDANLDSVKSKIEAKRGNASANGSVLSAKQLELHSGSSCAPFETTVPGRKKILEAWGPYFKKQLNDGRKIYLLTFQFGELQKEEFSCLEIMEREIKRFYTTLATRAVRKPHSASGKEKLPIMLAAPDVPVRKNNRSNVLWEADAYLNDGLHYHAVIAVHPDSRIRLMEHLDKCKDTYVIPKHALINVHVKRVKKDVEFVVDYVLKNVKYGKFDLIRVVTYPRPSSELLAQSMPKKP